MNLEEVDQFNYMGSTITNESVCTKEIKAMIGIAKIALRKNTKLITGRLNDFLRKILLKNYMSETVIHCNPLDAGRANYLENFVDIEENIRWTDKVRNECSKKGGKVNY